MLSIVNSHRELQKERQKEKNKQFLFNHKVLFHLRHFSCRVLHSGIPVTILVVSQSCHPFFSISIITIFVSVLAVSVLNPLRPTPPSIPFRFVYFSAQHLHQSYFLHEELEKASWKGLAWQFRTENKLGVHNFKRSLTKATPAPLPRVCLSCSKTAREKSFNKQKLHQKSFGVIQKDSIATFIISLSFDYGFFAFLGHCALISFEKYN